MFTKALRIALFSSLLLFISMGLYGQFSSKLKHPTLTNSILQSDSDKHYSQDSFGGMDEFMDIVDFDDDDDVSFSLRKKISFEVTGCFFITQNILHRFCNTLHSKFYGNTNFYHLAPSHFISLRVFRI